MKNPFSSVFQFYYEGFKNMKLGKTLWLLILIKIFIIFVVLRMFFFPNILNTHFKSDSQKANFVGNQLIERNVKPK